MGERRSQMLLNDGILVEKNESGKICCVKNGCEDMSGYTAEIIAETEKGNMDGLADEACFQQPTALYCEGNTLFVVDLGNQSLRFSL